MKRKVPNISENSKKKKAKMEEENPLETFLDNDSENVLDFFKLPEIEEKVVQLVNSEKLWRKLSQNYQKPGFNCPEHLILSLDSP